MTWIIVIIGIIVLIGILGVTGKSKNEQPDSGTRGIFLTGPTTRPNLPTELKPFVNELVKIYKKHNSFDSGARTATRNIGEQINTAHGYNAMVTVCDTISFVINKTAGRELEYVWNNIGEWRN